MSETNKEVVRKIEEAWDSNNLDALDAMFAPDFKQFSGFPGAPPTLESPKQAHMAAIQAMPDRKTEIQEMMAEDDRVMIRVRVTGTNTGGFPVLNIPANGNKIDIEWISIYTVKDGKAVDHRAIMDVAGLMQQLTAT